MKKLLSIIFTAIFALSLSACSSRNTGSGDDSKNSAASQSENSQAAAQVQSSPELTADEALDIALEQAGVTKDSIRDLENKLETENGVLVYDIDFESGNIEYSYEIDAQTGAIVETDRDHNDSAVVG